MFVARRLNTILVRTLFIIKTKKEKRGGGGMYIFCDNDRVAEKEWVGLKSMHAGMSQKAAI